MSTLRRDTECKSEATEEHTMDSPHRWWTTWRDGEKMTARYFLRQSPKFA